MVGRDAFIANACGGEEVWTIMCDTAAEGERPGPPALNNAWDGMVCTRHLDAIQERMGPLSSGQTLQYELGHGTHADLAERLERGLSTRYARVSKEETGGVYTFHISN